MSKPSRLTKPFKQSPTRREPPGDRSQLLAVGERLMRAGSEGNLLRPRPAQELPQASSHGDALTPLSCLAKEPVKGDTRSRSDEDAESVGRRSSSADESDRSDPWSPRTVPRRHTVGGARSARDLLPMRPHNMDRKREAFLEHLKLKYPHHASAIMGHQERLRDQVRSPLPGPCSQLCVGDQGERLSLAALEALEAMSEGDSPTTFTRGTRNRASLPVVRSANQTKDRSLGVLYLQYGDQTKQIRMPNEVTSADTVRALFVSAFPHQLSMKMLESPSVAVYIKDDLRNMYYELTDVRNITSHSCLKVYHKDPAQAFSHTPRPSSGDARGQRERPYSGRDGQPALRQPQSGGHSPIHAVQGSMSPPAARSMPSSPSRIPYGPRAGAVPASATLPRERLSSVPPTRSVPASPSAILERRDVMPDEDVGAKGVAPYADPYGLPEARLSIASSQGTRAGDAPDGGGAYLHRHGSIKSASGYAEGQEQHALYRQKSRKYGESQLPPLGAKTPPQSPHRVNEVRMIDIHPNSAQGVPLERSSPVRRSFRKDGNGARGTAPPPVFVDVPPGHGEWPFQGPMGDAHTSERMKAMEQQIANLTGLLQQALLKGTSPKDAPSEDPLRSAAPPHGGVPPAVQSPVAMPDAPSCRDTPPSGRDTPLSSTLATLRRGVCDLRLQLKQLRLTQLQNQEEVKAMVQQTEQEIAGRLTEASQSSDGPEQKQRSQVEEERHRYLAMEEVVLLELGELEKYVEKLKRDSMSAVTHQPITLRDVEEGAVNLRKVGEALASLKGEFPALQQRMRAVLRVEVEAVRFLKEEPHKMDSMLKRVKALTDALSGLRRSASEGSQPAADPATALPTSLPGSGPGSPTPQPRSLANSSRSEVVPTSPGVVQRVLSSPVSLQPCQVSTGLSHHPSPPLTPTHARDAAAVAKVIPRSREGSPALQKRHAPPAGPVTPTSGAAAEPDALSEVETQEKKPEEEASPSTAPPSGEEMERLLQQTQATLMEAIPDLEVPSEVEKANPSPSPALPDQVDAPQPVAASQEPDTQPEPVADKPVQTGSPRSPQAAVEKPPRPSVDRAKPSPEKSCKSPPPPPPRRVYPPGAGLTTSRSGEVVFTSRKEPANPQEGQEEAAPLPKPPRVRPEVKPKPLSLRTPPPSPAAAPAPAVPTACEEDEEGDKIMAELQVFQRYSKDLEPKYIVDLTSMESPVRALEPSVFSFDLEQTPQSQEGQQTERRTESAPPSRVVYCLTGTTKVTSVDEATREEVPKESSEGTVSPSQVAQANASIFPPKPEHLASAEGPVDSPPSVAESQLEPESTQPPIAAASQKDGHGAEGEDRAPVPEEKVKETSQNAPESTSPVTEPEKEAPAAPEVASSPDGLEPQTVVGEKIPDGLSERSGGNGGSEDEEQFTARPSTGQVEYSEEASLSPDLPGEEAPPPPPADNMAFVITNTKVQALSTGEYQQLVNAQGSDVQTVQLGPGPTATPEDYGIDRKPVIIIFDEPMDIRQAYKRLSTIFECEEELERMLTEERIDEESEEEEEENSQGQVGQVNPLTPVADPGIAKVKAKILVSPAPPKASTLQEGASVVSSPADDGSKPEPTNDSKQEAKKKFKFKFPKKQLAAIGQALRTGTKSGKKTLQVVVYEDEEEPDGTVTEFKETKRFEIKSQIADFTDPPPSQPAPPLTTQERTDEICKNTYKTINSLEETIKQLESTISDMGPHLSVEGSREHSSTKRAVNQTDQMECSPSKRPAPLLPKPHKLPQRKKAKAPLHPRAASDPTSPSTKQNTSSPSASPSRIAVPSPKSRQPPASPEKPGKNPKLQDPQRQFRQIPAFCPSMGKSSVPPGPTSKAPRPTNPPSSSSSSSSCFKSSIPCLSAGRPGRSPPPPSGAPPRPPAPPHKAKGHSLSLSPHTHNGRAHPLPTCSYSSPSSSSSSSYSSSSSSVSPTSTSTSSSSSPSSPRALPVASFSGAKPQSEAACPAPPSRDLA